MILWRGKVSDQRLQFLLGLLQHGALASSGSVHTVFILLQINYCPQPSSGYSWIQLDTALLRYRPVSSSQLASIPASQK